MKKLKLLLCIILFIFSFSIANAGISITPLKFEFEVKDGTTKREKVKITNTGDSAITLYSSREDFMAGDDSGTPKFVKPEEQDNPEFSLSNWIQIEDKNIVLAPKETKEVYFNIIVPPKSEPGGHYAAIFFSPGIPGGAQIAMVQRLGVLILVNVPGEVKIEGKLNSFKIGKTDAEMKNFVESKEFNNFPIIFETKFGNSGNIHIKPKGKIELIDENGENLKNIGKESIISPAGAYVGEKMVDYLPINDIDGNVLPKSERKFDSVWEGFGYTVLNDDGTRSVKFKNLTDYYASKASENAQFLMFWQSINSRKVTKKITAKYEIYYEGKDKVKKEFLETKDFMVSYEEKYVGLNYYILVIGGIIIIGILSYFVVVAPKAKARKEEELRRKIMEEINKNK